ncbi:tetratricopeptide repeat protein [Granulicella sibirica]|uniref:Tetratricopeptide repeat protein n=1 Tax=Granulicella sibirica TaxID=2479048 RepID=A0A4Q0SWM6_9BACT|nr:tetratricopeptide repeat protein [Granulicella sibirica]RXH54350.1 tetratricopeptide repeat protein [Granulicella sibirica]
MKPPTRTRIPALILASLLCALFIPASRQAAESPAKTHPLADPDKACAQCHEAIYEHYEKTSMARGSGLATEGLLPGELHHKASGSDYRVFLRDSDAWMSYSESSTGAQGERRLLYFIGSGRHGRTYLYQLEGQWFELPINFYTRRSTWDMAPAYDKATTIPAPPPTDANCLHCHATQVQQPLPTARNRYADAPFVQGGVGCSACHGDPSQHLAQHGHGPILNPAKLSPAKRDSTCLQCHLEGDAVVYRPGKSLAQFQPGEELSATALYFVRASQQAGGGRASSQYEALLRSACKRAVGDALTCTTCHDPHSSPAAAERVSFFRSKCLNCHAAQAADHHPEQQDCATCHMPTRNTSDISHEQSTDHNIQARPSAPSLLKSDDLVPVGPAKPTDREYGLAYAQLARRGNRAAGERALALLTKAQQSGANDAQVDLQLAFLQQISQHPVQARANYEAALQQDPYDPTSLANLAVIDASSNRVEEAVVLLKKLVSADPSQTPAGLNLAFIECRLGRKQEALAVLHRMVEFNPGDVQVHIFLSTGAYAGQHCPLTGNGSTE